MTYYASFDPNIASPSPVNGWYNTEEFDYPNLPDSNSRITLTQEQWDSRLNQKWGVTGGQLVVYVDPSTTDPSTLIKAALKDLAAYRWQQESKGVFFAGTQGAGVFGSDDSSQAKINAAYTMAAAGLMPNGTVWKLLDGSFVVLSATEVMNMAAKIANYVGECFAYEAELAAQIVSGQNPDITKGWPSNQ
jgi:hypothetical protein